MYESTLLKRDFTTQIIKLSEITDRIYKFRKI